MSVHSHLAEGSYQYGLEFRRRHLKPLELNQFLQPVYDESESVIVNPGNVSRVKISISVDCKIGILGVVQISCPESHERNLNLSPLLPFITLGPFIQSSPSSPT